MTVWMQILFLSTLLLLCSCNFLSTEEKKLVTHIPIYNPEGEKFARDEEFYKAYNKYQSRKQQKPQNVINNLYEKEKPIKNTGGAFTNADGIDLSVLKNAKIIEYEHSSGTADQPNKKANKKTKTAKKPKRASWGLSRLFTKELNTFNSKANKVLSKKHEASDKKLKLDDSNQDQTVNNESSVQNFLDNNHLDNSMNTPVDEEEMDDDPDLSSLIGLQLKGQSEEILQDRKEDTAEEEMDVIPESTPDDGIFLEDDYLIKQDVMDLFDQDTY